MTLKTLKAFLLILGFASVMAAVPCVASAPVLPNPVISLTLAESITQGGKTFVRYNYEVFNRSAYPDAMFAAAPNLPPCGANTKASRTWVDFFDSRGKRLYGFCALGKPSDLGQIWFALEQSVLPPSYVYIEMTDRQTNTKYKSNLADTSPYFG